MKEEPAILKRVEADGFRVFRGPWNVNLIGIRSKNRDQSGDLFDDWFHVVFQDETKNWINLAMRSTSDPGNRWMTAPMRSDGCAVKVAGRQYRGLWKLGLHRGKIPALVQVGKCAYYRDNDRDKILDLDPATIKEGVVGLNCHPSGPDSQRIGLWSAGCTVLPNQEEFDMLLSICRRSASIYGPRFSYTLLDER